MKRLSEVLEKVCFAWIDIISQAFYNHLSRFIILIMREVTIIFLAVESSRAYQFFLINHLLCNISAGNFTGRATECDNQEVYLSQYLSMISSSLQMVFKKYIESLSNKALAQ